MIATYTNQATTPKPVPDQERKREEHDDEKRHSAQSFAATRRLSRRISSSGGSGPPSGRVTLRNAIERLAELDDAATIYVEGGPDSWSAESEAGVGVEDFEAGVERLPPEAEGRTYFLEVAVAKDVLAGWASNLDHTPTLEESIARVIDFARHDA